MSRAFAHELPVSHFCRKLNASGNSRREPEMRMQFAGVIEREISTPVEATNRRPKQHRPRFVQSRGRGGGTSACTSCTLFAFSARRRRELLLGQVVRNVPRHVGGGRGSEGGRGGGSSQLKAPAEIRCAARPAELIALRAPARARSFRARPRSRGLFKPAF